MDRKLSLQKNLSKLLDILLPRLYHMWKSGMRLNYEFVTLGLTLKNEISYQS